MRLGAPSPAAVREQRSEQLRRGRAAAPALRVVYPRIRQLRLELTFEGGGPANPAFQVHVLHPPARAFFEFPCPFADCAGRFELAAAVDTALASPALRTEGTLECTGLRARDHGPRQSCGLRLLYTITATADDGTQKG